MVVSRRRNTEAKWDRKSLGQHEVKKTMRKRKKAERKQVGWEVQK